MVCEKKSWRGSGPGAAGRALGDARADAREPRLHRRAALLRGRPAQRGPRSAIAKATDMAANLVFQVVTHLEILKFLKS